MNRSKLWALRFTCFSQRGALHKKGVLVSTLRSFGKDARLAYLYHSQFAARYMDSESLVPP